MGLTFAAYLYTHIHTRIHTHMCACVCAQTHIHMNYCFPWKHNTINMRNLSQRESTVRSSSLWTSQLPTPYPVHKLAREKGKWGPEGQLLHNTKKNLSHRGKASMSPLLLSSWFSFNLPWAPTATLSEERVGLGLAWVDDEDNCHLLMSCMCDRG